VATTVYLGPYLGTLHVGYHAVHWWVTHSHSGIVTATGVLTRCHSEGTMTAISGITCGHSEGTVTATGRITHGHSGGTVTAIGGITHGD
jgi:hypothetical protein